jgi:phospholipid transport system transporter-binding protein
MALATAERDGDTLRVRGELDFDSVAELWAATETPISTEPIFRVDLGGVQRSNSAGVALLVQWLGQARRRQVELVFVNIPAQMRAIIAIADLDTILPLAR